MKQIKAEWILCPICGNKTRTMIREDTESYQPPFQMGV